MRTLINRYVGFWAYLCFRAGMPVHLSVILFLSLHVALFVSLFMWIVLKLGALGINTNALLAIGFGIWALRVHGTPSWRFMAFPLLFNCALNVLLAIWVAN